MNETLKTILVIIVVVALGLFIFNQWLEYRYKTQFLMTPCELCAELNKNQSKCIERCFMVNPNQETYVINLTPILENEKTMP